MQQTLRIATRSSQLALWQSQHVATLLRRRWPRLRLKMVPITSRGDADQSTPLYGMGGVGVFCSEVQQAVLNDEADIGVHSLKDLPTTPAAGLTIAAFIARVDPRDALISAHGKGLRLAELPPNGVVASSSLRRRQQLASIRPDLQFVDIRGNVHTRLRKINDGLADATLLAMAGLERLNLLRHTRAVPLHPVTECTPAPGQGVVAVDCRSGDTALQRLLATIDHLHSRQAAHIERLVLAGLRGGCSLPLGCYAHREGSRWQVYAKLGDHGNLISAQYAGAACHAAPNILSQLQHP